MNRKIYKYFRPEYGIDMLRTGELYLSGVGRYNDIFEQIPASKYLSNPRVSLEELKNMFSTEEGKSVFEKWGVNNFVESLLTPSNALNTLMLYPFLNLGIAGALSSFGLEGELDEKDELKRLSIYLNKCQATLKTIKFCCFSSTPDNILMWTHYTTETILRQMNISNTDNAGIVVSFRTNPQFWADAMFYDIDYDENRLPLPKENEKIISYIEKLLLRKAKYWEYEQEIRLIKLNCATNRLRVNSDAISSIRLGVNISKENKDEVLRIRDEKYPTVPVLQAKRSDYEYKLDFVKL